MKAHTDKVLIIGLMLCLMIIVTTPNVMASKEYNETENSYSTYDWMFFNKYDIKLNEVGDSIINAWAEGELITHKDVKVFKKLYYKDTEGNSHDFNDDYKFMVNYTYQWFKYIPAYNCTNETGYNETTEEYYNYTNCTEVLGEWVDDVKWRWVEVDVKEKIPEGSYLWRIEAKKPRNSVIDFIITTDDEGDLEEWAWWNNTWLYKRELSNLTGEYPTLNISYETDKMNEDFSDLRFVANDTTELNYTIRNVLNDTWAYITIDTNNQSNNIFMYYNNSEATSQSSANDTWNFPLNFYSFDINADDLTGNVDGVNNNADHVSNGRIGGAFDFDDSNLDYIDIDNADAGVTEVTLLAWINMDGSTGDTQSIIDGERGVAKSIDLAFFEAQGNFSASAWGSTSDSVFSQGVTNYNQWYHVVQTLDSSGNIEIFVNATSQDTSSITSWNGYEVQTIGIDSGNSGRNFDGRIDEVLIYSRELTPHEISEIYSMSDQTDSYILGDETPDNEAPVVNLIGPANDTTVNSNGYSANFSVFVTDTQNDIDNCTLKVWNVSDDSLKYTQTNTSIINNTQVEFTQVLMASNYTWNVFCVDNQSLEGSNATNWTINVIPIPDNAPEVTLLTPANNTNYITAPQTIDFTCNASDDIKLDNVSLYINNVLNQTNASGINDTTYTFTTTIGEGNYYWSCEAVDNQSQVTRPAARNFIIDAGPPNVTITAPSNGTVITQYNQSFNLNWTITDRELDSCWWQEEEFVIEYCYQESPNVTNQTGLDGNCGLSYTGNYYYTGSPPTPLNGVDGSFSTAVGGGNYVYYVNYTKPNNAQLGTLITYRNFLASARNVTIPSSCLYAFGNKIGLKVEKLGIQSILSCMKTDNTFQTLETISGSANFYEEAIYWNTTRNFNKTIVTCNDNTTALNYPTTNPDTYTVYLVANDTLGRVGSDDVTVVKSTNAPDINITTPLDNYATLKTGDILDLNFSITNVTTLDDCIWNYNGVNESILCSNNSFQFVYQGSVNSVTVYANDTLGNLNSTTKTFTVDLIENSQTYPASTTEGSTETFLANVTLRSGVIVQSVGFVYDGTTYIGEVFASGSDYITRMPNFIIPNVDNQTNKTFYFNLTLSSGSNAILTSYNVTVNPINVDDCSLYNNTILYFTNVKEKEQTIISNSTIEYAVNILTSDNSITLLSVSNETTNNPLEICLGFNLTDSSNYLLDTIIKYTGIDGNTTYSIEYYNIDNLVLNNETELQNITLYDLDASNATEFKVTYTGSDFVPVENALIYVNRQYIAENVFKTVELPKTDNNGQTLVHLVRNDQIYNFVVVVDGAVVGSFNNIIAFCDDFSIGDCQIQLNGESTGDTIYNNTEALGITYTTPTYDNTTRFVSTSFVTSDGSVKDVTMTVTRNDVFGNTSVCTSSVSSSGGTLTCEVPSYITDTNLKTVLTVDGLEAVSDTVTLVDIGYGVYGFFVLFIYLLSFTLMFTRSKTLLIIGTTLGVLTGLGLGLIEGKAIGGGAIGVSLIVAAVLMVWKLNKEKIE